MTQMIQSIATMSERAIEKGIRNILEEFGIDVRNTKYTKVRNTKNRRLLQLDLSGDARPIDEIIKDKEKRMKEAAKALEFELAAILRDEIRELRARK